MLAPLTRRSVLSAAALLLAPIAAAAETKNVSAASLKQVIDVARQLSLPAGLPKGIADGVGAIVEKLKSDPDTANKAWAALVAKHGAGLDEPRVAGVARWLVRKSVLETAPKLAAVADRARFFTDQKAAIESQLGQMRKLKEKGPPPYELRALTLTATYAKGAPASKLATTATSLSGPAFAAVQKELEEKLSTVGDDAQLANVDLQNALQKQQQTLQMMSNISKMVHDTAMSTIRKIGG